MPSFSFYHWFFLHASLTETNPSVPRRRCSAARGFRSSRKHVAPVATKCDTLKRWKVIPENNMGAWMVPENMGIICFDRKYGSKIWWFPKSRFWPIPIWQSHGCWFVSSTLTTGYHSNIPGSKPWHAAAHIISTAGMDMFKILRCLINIQCIILYDLHVYIHYIILYIYII